MSNVISFQKYKDDKVMKVIQANKDAKRSLDAINGQIDRLLQSAKTYGVKDIAYSGPTFKSLKIKKSKAIVSFDFTGKGLEVKGKEVKEFYIAGSDKKFYPAKVKIDGSKVELKSKKVKKPVAVRFGFSDTSLPNLYNSHGLPAAAFRTDNWEVKTK